MLDIGDVLRAAIVMALPPLKDFGVVQRQQQSSKGKLGVVSDYGTYL